MGKLDGSTDPELKAVLGRAKGLLELAGTLAVLAIPLFALRVFVVADFNPDVASALAANSSPSSLITSIALSLVPYSSLALGIGLALLAGWQGEGLGRKRFYRGLALFMLSLAATIPAALTQFDLLTLSIMLSFLIAAVPVGARRGPSAGQEGDWEANMVRWSPAWIGVAAVVAILFAPMWLPPERVVLAGVPTTVYVLTVGSGQAVLFMSSQNSVFRVPAEDLVDRQFCIPEPRFTTFADLIFGGPEGLPVCP